ECNTAVWREDNKMGWQMPTWALRESHLQLLSYNIEAQLLLYGGQPTHIKAEPKKFRFWKPSNPLGQQEKPAKLGVWRDSLGDLLDSIENADQGIVCEAVVGSSKEGSEVATLRMEIDVSATRAHRIPRELACKEVDGWPLEKAPLRRGAPAKEILQNKVQYFVTVMVDGLPGHELCLPYVRVSMGAVSECTEAKKAHSVNNVTFDKALSINCTLVNRKAKIEILNRGSGGVFSRDKVIGEGVIYDVEPDKEYWIHCFGGAANATYPDVANQMVKGAVRPASTHTASVAVKFGTKMVSKVYFESLKRMRKPSRLTVRLYSGVNLKSYAGRKVNVVVKAGAAAPSAARATSCAMEPWALVKRLPLSAAGARQLYGRWGSYSRRLGSMRRGHGQLRIHHPALGCGGLGQGLGAPEDHEWRPLGPRLRPRRPGRRPRASSVSAAGLGAGAGDGAAVPLRGPGARHAAPLAGAGAVQRGGGGGGGVPGLRGGLRGAGAAAGAGAEARGHLRLQRLQRRLERRSSSPRPGAGPGAAAGALPEVPVPAQASRQRAARAGAGCARLEEATW
ncbi:unnamed protein product, partial [Effrenium voratum]